MSLALKPPLRPSIFYMIRTMLDSVSSAKYLGVTITDDLSWSTHIDNITKSANQTLGFLKRNIQVHNKDLKSVAYKTLVRPQLEYPLTVWSPHTATDIQKVEAVQRRAARWVYRDYSYTSSVTAKMKDLNWRFLDQRRIDSRLIPVMLYKVTYDLVAIPSSQYLTRNTRLSRHRHPLSYRQIPTLKDYYRFTFFPGSIIHWNGYSDKMDHGQNGPDKTDYVSGLNGPYRRTKRTMFQDKTAHASGQNGPRFRTKQTTF